MHGKPMFKALRKFVERVRGALAAFTSTPIFAITGIEMPAEFKKASDIEQGFKHVVERLDALDKRDGGASAEDLGNLRKEVEALVAGQKALAEREAEYRAVSDVMGGKEFMARAAMLQMPFEPDEEFKNVTKAQWNVISFHPEELAFAAQESSGPLWGMSPAIKRHLRRDENLDAFTRAVKDIQHLNDAIVLVDGLLSAGNDNYRNTPRAERIKSLRLWKMYEKPVDSFIRAISGGATPASGSYGGAWLPQMFSAQMHDLVQLQTAVWGLFPVLDMPGKIYTSPVLGADGLAYVIPENPASQGGAGGAGTAINESTPQTTNMTLTAVKLAARMFTSSEAVEDLLIPVIPFLLGQLAKVTARALDDACINGDDTAGTNGHMDDPATGGPLDPPSGTTDRRRAWKGLRAAVILNSGMPKVDVSGNTDTVFWSLKSGCGIYGLNPADGVFITSITGFFKMLQMADANGGKWFQRADMAGFAANALLTGQMATLMGSPIIVSEFVPTDTDGVSGKRTGTGTYTEVIWTHRPSWQRGLRRAFNVQQSTQRHIEYDQTVLVSTYRAALSPWFSIASGAGQQKITSLGIKF